MKAWLVTQVWTELLYLDVVGLRGFQAVQRAVRRVRPTTGDHADDVTGIINALHTACVLYFRPTRCLQRSAVVTRLLRRRGIAADLVIGCAPLPLRAHAWVEVDGTVVSDNLDDLEHFHVLDRW